MEGIDERVIFLILFVVIGAVKWVFERIKGPEQPHDVSDTLEDMYEDFREEIRQRQTEVQQPAAAPPPLPQATPQPVHIPTKPPASAKPENFRVNKKALSAEEKAAIERFQNLGKRRKKRSSGGATGSVRDMLSTPGSARKAVVLKEILGKPRSMQRI